MKKSGLGYIKKCRYLLIFNTVKKKQFLVWLRYNVYKLKLYISLI